MLLIVSFCPQDERIEGHCYAFSLSLIESARWKKISRQVLQPRSRSLAHNSLSNFGLLDILSE